MHVNIDIALFFCFNSDSLRQLGSGLLSSFHLYSDTFTDKPSVNSQRRSVINNMNPTCAQNLVFQFTVLHMFTEDAILKQRFVTGSSPNSGKTTSSQPWSQTTAPRCCPKLSASPSLSSTASSLPQASSALGHSHTHIHKMNTSLLVISFYVSERENEIFTSGGKQIHILTSEFNYW